VELGRLTNRTEARGPKRQALPVTDLKNMTSRANGSDDFDASAIHRGDTGDSSDPHLMRHRSEDGVDAWPSTHQGIT
jgi:hypothetical protein